MASVSGGGAQAYPRRNPVMAKRFGKSVEEDGALAHARIREDAGVFPAVVEKFGVDLIADDDEVVFDGEAGDFLQFLRRFDGAGGIGGEIQHEDFRLVRERRFDIAGHEGEVVFRAGGDGDGNPVGHGDAGVVGDVAGLVVDDFVARVEEGAEGEVERLGDADGDEDLVFRIVGDVEVGLDVSGD